MAGTGSSRHPISTASTPSVGTNPSRRRNPPKNAPGQKQDIGWKHGYPVDGNPNGSQCMYCKRVFTSGGVYRLKHHLACTKKDVAECKSVPDDVREVMWNILVDKQQKLIERRDPTPPEFDEVNSVEEVDNGKRKKVDLRQPQITGMFKRGISSQTTLNSAFKRREKEAVDKDVAEYFYDNAIPFNVANNEKWKKMVKSIAAYGPGYEPPSYHEIRETLLKVKVEETNAIKEEHREYWKKYGCTIMTDGWTDQRKRTLLNFCVHSPKGNFFLKSVDASGVPKTADKILEMLEEVVDDVGEENVVQVVTDNAANYKLAGQMLMQKRDSIYWTPCAAHCIDLMLEDFERKLKSHKVTIAKGRQIARFIYLRSGLVKLLHYHTGEGELVRHGATRFATSYLSLGSLNENRGALTNMFNSPQWKKSQYAKLAMGNEVEKTVLDPKFWVNVVVCIKGAFPLLKVLRMVDSDDKPAMAYIYEAMEKAKVEIQQNFKDKQDR